MKVKFTMIDYDLSFDANVGEKDLERIVKQAKSTYEGHQIILTDTDGETHVFRSGDIGTIKKS